MMKPTGHILVIRLSAIGDVAMTVPVLRILSAKYPELKITVLTRKFFAPLFLEIPNVSVYEAEVRGRHKGFSGLKRLAKELRDLNIDAVADLHNVLRTHVLNFFFGLHRIPVAQINKGRKEKKALTREKNKLFKQLKTTHQRYADVFAVLELPIQLEPYKLEKHRPTSLSAEQAGLLKPCRPDQLLDKKALSSEVKKITGKKTQKWMGLAPFAKHSSKTYPLDLMKAVLNRLQEENNLKIFLFGGGTEEKAILTQWENEFENCINLAGKFTFEEELAIISNLDAMLSMDSANGHLAAIYGVPVITLWGNTHPFAGFAPFGQPKSNSLVSNREKFPQIPTSVYGKKVPKGYEEVMRSISVDQVMEKLRRQIF